MGRNIGTFLDLEEISELANEANSKFDDDKKFTVFLFVSGCLPKHFDIHVAVNNKKQSTIEYKVFNIDGKIIVTCDNDGYKDNCGILAETIESYIERKNEKNP